MARPTYPTAAPIQISGFEIKLGLPSGANLIDLHVDLPLFLRSSAIPRELTRPSQSQINTSFPTLLMPNLMPLLRQNPAVANRSSIWKIRRAPMVRTES